MTVSSSSPKHQSKAATATMKNSTEHTGAAKASSILAFVSLVALVLFWYAVNVALLIANKWLISTTGFRDTTLLTLMHMLTCTAASGVLMIAGVVPSKTFGPPLLFKVAVLSLSFTISVAACMASLAYLPASFAQAMGSSTPAITAFLAFIIQGRVESPITYLALLPVVAGIALASGGEPLFNLVGMLLQVLACSARSLKTVLQAAMLTDERDRFHPMALLGYTSAISAGLLLPLVACVEPRGLRHAAALHAANPSFAPLLAFSCTMAFLVNWTNFIISKKLGALTLQVLGNFKNVVAAGASIAVFNNPVTAMGLAGYGITTAGVLAYSNLVRMYPAKKVTPLMSLGMEPAAGDAAGSNSATSPRMKDVEAAADWLSAGNGNVGGGLSSFVSLGGLTGVRRGKEGEEAGEREPLLARAMAA